jgi:hypothetical protein
LPLIVGKKELLFVRKEYIFFPQYCHRFYTTAFQKMGRILPISLLNDLLPVLAIAN